MTGATARRVTPSARLVLPAAAPEEDWLSERREGIGSSDLPAVMGVSKYQTPRHVYHDKRGELVEDGAGEPALWGKLLEEPIAREWARRNRSVIRKVGLVAHTERDWMRCTLDRRITECPLDRSTRESCALEVKTRNAFVADRWHRAVPDDVLAQTLWQIGVTGYDHVHVAVLIGGQDYRQAIIRRTGSEALIEDLITVAGRLWADIRAGRPPALADADPDARLDLADRLHPDRDGVTRLDGDALDVLADLDDYEGHRLAEAREKRAKDAAKARLVERLGPAELGVLDNELAYSYATATRTAVDVARLAERWPDAHADCLTTSEHRRLSITRLYRLRLSEDADVPA